MSNRFQWVAVLLALSTGAVARDRCFELSSRGNSSNGKLCISEEASGRLATAVLSENNVTVAKLTLALKLRARCLDCNADVFGPVSPSVFGKIFEIRFEGKRAGGVETGTVRIGDQRYAYRWSNAAAVGPPPAAPVAPLLQGMAPDSFEQLLGALEKNQFSVSGIEGVVSSAAQTNRFTCVQVAAVLQKVPGQALKESAAKQLVPRIVDDENIAIVSTELRDNALKYRR
ncbi:MAG: DUF4476 domain-containing protein [Myxococcaceae bacterium]|nr:DUF4476 domain-containing protein [Myxococcaceae bacterium]